MKIEVWTGQTKARENTMLMPVLLGQEGGDRVFLLLHSEGKPSGSDTLHEECVAVLTHAVLEGEGPGYDRLESALKELNGLLKGFLLSETVREVHAVVGLLEKSGALHISHVGRAEAYVVRDGAAIQVTEYYRGKPPSAFMHIVSGDVQAQDQFVIATQRLLRALTPAQLSQTVREQGSNAVERIVSKLADEREVACVLHIAVSGVPEGGERSRGAIRAVPERRARRGSGGGIGTKLVGAIGGINWSGLATKLHLKKSKGKFRGTFDNAVEWVQQVFRDLQHPERKRRAHLLILAGSVAVFIIVWVVVQLSLTSQRSQTRGDLQELVQQINADLSTAENRELAGDTDSANAILERAEERAREVMTNDSGLFRTEALELLDRINSKREEMNRIVRVVPPHIMASLTGKKADVLAQGFIGSPNGEFLVYDRQDLYRVSLNTVDSGAELGTEELILDGVALPRFQSTVFLTTGNGIVELAGGQATSMKTEDPAGWVTGVDIKTYLRYLYVLAPEKKQIYKYERLNDRYGPPAEYNVSGDLTGAIDMVITGPIYILRDVSDGPDAREGQREVLKLLRGEKQTMTIRNLPPGGLDNVTKIFKSAANGNFYFLDPVGKRIVVTTNDGDIGDSLYLKQYVLDSEQVGQLKDLFADPDDSRLYVLDEKRIYAIDLRSR